MCLIQKVENFAQYLAPRRRQLASVLPSHLTPERVCRVALSTVTKTPALLACDMASVFLAVQQAAELGLEPGGALGQCYLIPYGKNCQLIVSYKGLIELARRSGEIESIEARVVHERDDFSVELGLHSDIRHHPCLDGEPGKTVMAYAVARLKGGMTQFEVMTRAEVDAIRRRSRSGNSGPWVTDYDEMARKTVVRRLCKYLPISNEKVSAALEIESADFQKQENPVPAPDIDVQTGEVIEVIDETTTAAPEEQLPPPTDVPATKAKKLAEKLKMNA